MKVQSCLESAARSFDVTMETSCGLRAGDAAEWAAKKSRAAVYIGPMIGEVADQV